MGITCDKKGEIIVADSGNHTIRKLSKDGVLSTLCGKPGTTGYVDGTGDSTRLNGPFTFAYDRQGKSQLHKFHHKGTLYFTEFHSHSIRTLSEDGQVRVFAGANAKGSKVQSESFSE